MATLVFGAALEFQSSANGRRGFRRPGLDRRTMRIMAVRAIVKRTLTLPVRDTFTVSSKRPVLMAVCVTATANHVCLVKIHQLVQQSLQIIAIFEVVTRQAPNTPSAVFQVRVVHRIQRPNFRVGFHGFVALITRVEEKIVFARQHGNLRGVRITFESYRWRRLSRLLRIHRQQGRATKQRDHAGSPIFYSRHFHTAVSMSDYRCAGIDTPVIIRIPYPIILDHPSQ